MGMVVTHSSRCQLVRLKQIILLRNSHVLRNHIPVVLIDRIVFIAIGIYVYFIKLMVNFWFEELLDLEPSFLCGEFLSQSQK